MEINDKEKIKAYIKKVLPLMREYVPHVTIGAGLVDHKTKMVLDALCQTSVAFEEYRKKVIRWHMRKPWPRKKQKRFHRMRVGG